MEKTYRAFPAELKSFDDEKLTVTHFISTETRDRVGDRLMSSGMKTLGRPVVLLAHGFSQIGPEPIAKPISLTPGEHKGIKGIIAKTQFFDGSHLQDNTGQRLYQKAKGGYLVNWAVGYIALKWVDLHGPKGEYWRDIIEWDLLEYSPVGVPMNPECTNVDKCGKCKTKSWFGYPGERVIVSDDLLSQVGPMIREAVKKRLG
jgi:hypothetical protein